MDVDDLADVRRNLRAFAVEQGLQWVLDEVDAAVAAGISEVRTYRESTRRGTKVLVEVEPAARGRRRMEEFVTRRPMTDLEQTEALLTGLRRVLVDLDDVARTSVGQINELGDLHRRTTAEIDEGDSTQVEDRSEVLQDPAGRRFGPIDEIDFVADEGSADPPVSTRGMRDGSRSDRARSVLDEIERIVRS